MSAGRVQAVFFGMKFRTSSSPLAQPAPLHHRWSETTKHYVWHLENPTGFQVELSALGEGKKRTGRTVQWTDPVARHDLGTMTVLASSNRQARVSQSVHSPLVNLGLPRGSLIIGETSLETGNASPDGYPRRMSIDSAASNCSARDGLYSMTR